MLEQHLDFLICPNCSRKLTIEIFERFNELRIKDGMLICECGLWFPIINGVPRLLIGELRNLITVHHNEFLRKYGINKKIKCTTSDIIQEKTAKMHDVGIKSPSDNVKNNPKSFKDWIEPINEEFFQNKIILDAGCRIGTNTYHSSKFGAKLVIGLDIGETVEIAYGFNKDCENVLIIQADLNDVPTNQIFDFVYSIGVIHHIPKPKQGLVNLSKKIKHGGKMFVWVYGFENYFNLKTILFLRNFTTKMNIRSNNITSFLFSVGFFCQIKYQKKFGKVKNKWLDYLADFQFKNIQAYVFNQLAPPIAIYYKKKEFEELCSIERCKKLLVQSRWDNSWKGIMDLD